jgi:hypothetical protein
MLRSSSSALKYIGLLVVVILLGIMLRNDTLGTIVVILYGIASAFLKIPSIDTFKMIVLLFVYIAILVCANNAELARNMAQYAFLLLCFAGLSVFKEQRREVKKKL